MLSFDVVIRFFIYIQSVSLVSVIESPLKHLQSTSAAAKATLPTLMPMPKPPAPTHMLSANAHLPVSRIR